MEFKKFSKIERLEKIRMAITQKIHGTNAQIVIIPKTLDGKDLFVGVENYDVHVGSRNRWIYPGDDNYGFAAWVEENKEALIKSLGCGVHFGEWAGPGINSGEGLSEKTLVLFDWYRYENIQLPENVTTVPVLYHGQLHSEEIDKAAEELKKRGSWLVPGFMRPEGIVVQIGGVRYKYVFDPEETQWRKGDGTKEKKASKEMPDYSHLLQPIRLEKVISKDSRLSENYPSTMGDICNAYIEDLGEEGLITQEVNIRFLAPQVFPMIKAYFRGEFK